MAAQQPCDNMQSITRSLESIMTQSNYLYRSLNIIRQVCFAFALTQARSREVEGHSRVGLKPKIQRIGGGQHKAAACPTYAGSAREGWEIFLLQCEGRIARCSSAQGRLVGQSRVGEVEGWEVGGKWRVGKGELG